MSCIDVPVSETVLLTGAGFTNNFDGFLANKMWGIINRKLDDLLHNNNLLEENKTHLKKLIDLAKNEFDYEKIFEEVMKGKKYDELKDVINDIYFEAYKSMDDNIVRKGYLYGPEVCIDSNALKEFIRDLVGDQKERGFFFTLNQDISIERYFRTAITTPCIERINELDDSLKQGLFKNSWFGKVPNNEELVKRRLDKEGKWKNEKVYYVKLHGSFNWKASMDKNTDRNIMVIGTSKLEDIEKEPILKWYLEIFKCVLSKPNRRLLIIGYGFRDKHINDVILNSINDLELFLIYPKSPEDFYNGTLDTNDKKRIWDEAKRRRYYENTLEDIFTRGRKPDEYYELLRYFLGKKINY